MKIVCPNDPKHKRFTVMAHVTEEWIVDETGEFQDVTGLCGDCLHRPDKDDLYTCMDCYTEAKVEA